MNAWMQCYLDGLCSQMVQIVIEVARFFLHRFWTCRKDFKKYCEKEVPGIGASDEKEQHHFGATWKSWTADFVQRRCVKPMQMEVGKTLTVSPQSQNEVESHRRVWLKCKDVWHNLFRVKTDGRFCCLGTGDNPAPSVGCFHKLVRLGLSFTLWFTCLAIPHSGLSAWIVLWTCHLGISWYLDLVPGLLSGLFTCSSPAGEISFRPVCPPPGLLAWLRIWLWWWSAWIFWAVRLQSWPRLWTDWPWLSLLLPLLLPTRLWGPLLPLRHLLHLGVVSALLLPPSTTTWLLRFRLCLILCFAPVLNFQEEVYKSSTSRTSLDLWLVGQILLEGRLARPRPSTAIDLANQRYVVLRAPGHQVPLLALRAGDYRHVVGNFTSDTISVCGSTPVGKVSHGDAARRASREGLELKQGRRVLETTSSIRQKLLDAYVEWLVESGKDFDEICMAKTPDLDLINEELRAFGRWLFHQGKPYYHFSELMNSITSRRPILRRSLRQAWDLAFMWGSFEPVEHHIAMPHQVLVALIASAWCWGWSREAAIFALLCGALLRIGEVLQSKRGDVLMPEDVDFTVSYLLIRIKEPKTRFRAARHQASKVEQPDLISIIRLGFSGLRYDEPLWHLSGARLRARFVKLLETLKLPSKAYQIPKPLTLASFRPGGATWLIAECEDVELVKEGEDGQATGSWNATCRRSWPQHTSLTSLRKLRKGSCKLSRFFLDLWCKSWNSKFHISPRQLGGIFCPKVMNRRKVHGGKNGQNFGWQTSLLPAPATRSFLSSWKKMWSLESLKCKDVWHNLFRVKTALLHRQHHLIMTFGVLHAVQGKILADKLAFCLLHVEPWILE